MDGKLWEFVSLHVSISYVFFQIANCSVGSICSIKQPDCIPGEPCPGPVGECSTSKTKELFCHKKLFKYY